MLDAIKSFFSRSMSVPEDAGEGAEARDARLAACALLLELAYADEDFTDSERAHLEGTIRRQFGLDEEEATELLELAAREREGAVDLFQFTRLIDRHFTVAQKMVLAEAMWGLVYADGELEKREDYLIRKISNLLRLQPGYLAQARNRVRAKKK
ncbi:MAG: TerB family tellurite resistance protein [Gemmatimonadota bacterium]